MQMIPTAALSSETLRRRRPGRDDPPLFERQDAWGNFDAKAAAIAVRGDKGQARDHVLDSAPLPTTAMSGPLEVTSTRG